MSRLLLPKGHACERQPQGFDAVVVGASYRLTPAQSLTLWKQACSAAANGVDPQDGEWAQRQFHRLAERIAPRGGDLVRYNVGKTTRVEAELLGVGRDPPPTVPGSGTPGRRTRVDSEQGRWGELEVARVVDTVTAAPPHREVTAPGRLAARMRPGRAHDVASQGVLQQVLEIIARCGTGSPFAGEPAMYMAAELDAQVAAAGQAVQQLRIHTDDVAAEAAELLGAQAFSVGSHVYFARGQFAPGTEQGDRLLRHELAHVAQYLRGGLAAQAQPELTTEDSSAETEARTAEVPSTARPLEVGIRSRMERLFGCSFAAVRVEHGTRARAIGALAYTQGENIYFAPDVYRPESAAGLQLLAHELTHVVQQRAGGLMPRVSGSAISQDRDLEAPAINSDGVLEAEADRLGARAAAGEHVAVSGFANPASGVQRVADVTGYPTQAGATREAWHIPTGSRTRQIAEGIIAELHAGGEGCRKREPDKDGKRDINGKATVGYMIGVVLVDDGSYHVACSGGKAPEFRAKVIAVRERVGLDIKIIDIDLVVAASEAMKVIRKNLPKGGILNKDNKLELTRKDSSRPNSDWTEVGGVAGQCAASQLVWSMLHEGIGVPCEMTEMLFKPGDSPNVNIADNQGRKVFYKDKDVVPSCATCQVFLKDGLPRVRAAKLKWDAEQKKRAEDLERNERFNHHQAELAAANREEEKRRQEEEEEEEEDEEDQASLETRVSHELGEAKKGQDAERSWAADEILKEYPDVVEAYACLDLGDLGDLGVETDARIAAERMIDAYLGMFLKLYRSGCHSTSSSSANPGPS